MSNSIFKRILDKVRFVTQKKQVSENYFFNEEQAPLFTEKAPTIEEPVVSTKKERGSSKIYSGSATWNVDIPLVEATNIFAEGLPKGDTLMIKHLK